MNSRKIIGIIGPGKSATPMDIETAFQMGKSVAKLGYVLLTGGRNTGVMEAAMKGAKSADGTTIGILPSADKTEMSKFVDIPIVTGMGSARNNINVLSSDLLIAIGTGPGTFSEIALAVKAGKSIILMNQSKESSDFLQTLNVDYLSFSESVEETVIKLKTATDFNF